MLSRRGAVRCGPRASPRLVRKLFSLTVLLIAFVAVGGASAASPRVAVFFYPWYSTAAHDGADGHWSQAGHEPPADLASSFYPLRGAYSSADAAVLRSQMEEISSTGAGVVVSSWWGTGSLEDQRLPLVAAAAQAQGLRIAVQIEPYNGRSATTVAADVERLRGLGIDDFYVYRAEDIPAADWAPVNARLRGVRLIAHTLLVGWAVTARFAGIYTYDVLTNDGHSFNRLCTQAHGVGLLCAPSVGPGFDATAATGDPRTRPRRDGATYDAMWRAAVRAGADIVTITSYNEWHEGTQIEPAAAPGRGSRYAGYDGAWGIRGAQAAGAYLARTALWVQRFDPQQATETPAANVRILAAWPDPPYLAGRRNSRTR